MKIAKLDPGLRREDGATGDGPQTKQGREPGSVPVDDLRISAIRALIAPQLLLEELPIDAAALATVRTARQAVHRLLHGGDDRLLAVVGPCSIHDYDTALVYAAGLQEAARRHAADLLIVM